MRSFKIMAILIAAFVAGCTSSANQNDSNNTLQFDRSGPLAVVLNDMGARFQESPSTLLIKQTVSGKSVESADNATVVIEEDTPTDDSVAAIRYSYQLSNINGAWIISSKNVTQRCVGGRGSAEFSAELCK